MKNGQDRDHQLEHYLSGEMSLDALPEELIREEVQLRELLEMLREDVAAPPEFRDDVMRAIERLSAPLWVRALGWALRPRPVRVSPAGGMALALAASVILFFAWPTDTPTDAGAAVDGAAAEVVTRFVFVAPDARSVRLTGDFVAWSREGVELEDLRGTGVWTVDVLLAPGVHEYTFIVNGTEWLPDPRAVSQVDDGFGRVNSVVIVSNGNAL